MSSRERQAPEESTGVVAAAVALTAIAVVALWLRVVGIGYGLPAVYNPDEVAIMNRALAFATGDFNPHNFLYPTFYFYVLFVWEGLTFVFTWLSGDLRTLAEFERSFFVDPTTIFLSGRLLSAIAGLLTVLAVARLGARLYGRRIGLIAAAILAVSPIAVQDAHYVKHDVPVTLLIVMATAAAASLLVDERRHVKQGAWVLAGVLAGLAMSTHYYAIFVALPIVAAAALGSRPRLRLYSVGFLVSAGLVTAATFLAGSPFLVVEPATAWRDIVANREIVMDRAVAPAGLFASLGRYVSLLALDGLGWTAFAASAVGVVLVFLYDWRRATFLIAFPLPFLLFIANTVPASRYLNPVLPFAAITAAVAIVALAERWRGASTVAAAGLTIAIGLPALTASMRTGAFFRATDTRTLALEFVTREVPPGSTVMIQPYSIPLRPTKASLVEGLRLHLGSEDKASVKFKRQLQLDPYPEPAYRLIWLGSGGLDAEKIYVPTEAVGGDDPLAPLRAFGVEYVALKYNAEDRSLARLRAALGQEGRLVATFSPYGEDVGGDQSKAGAPFLHNTDARIGATLARPGPTIEMWHIR